MDIKIKAWDPVRKQMYTNAKWVEFRVIKGELTARNFDRDDKYQDLTIIQFTGLTDKNGVDIYEGDILAAGEDVTSPVTFFDGGFHWITSAQQGRSPVLQDRTKRLEVIGNIFENKELLAQGG